MTFNNYIIKREGGSWIHPLLCYVPYARWTRSLLGLSIDYQSGTMKLRYSGISEISSGHL
jgi:hypothetical protein